jgi:branched-chain amino acid transport system substrate-binding protein
VVISQVVPPPSEASVPVVAEYREAAENLLNRKDYSFTSLEAYIGAKVIVEALRRAGPKITRQSFMHALDSMSGYDAGGFVVSFSPKDHNGSSFVELTIIGKDGTFKY